MLNKTGITFSINLVLSGFGYVWKRIISFRRDASVLPLLQTRYRCLNRFSGSHHNGKVIISKTFDVRFLSDGMGCPQSGHTSPSQFPKAQPTDQIIPS